jgi:hypothetical protein
MGTWNILPFDGAGPLRFGQTREEVRAQIGSDCTTFKKTPSSNSTTDSYEQLGVHLYFDCDGRLEFIETFPPCEIVYRGVPVSRREVETTLAELRQSELQVKQEEDGYICEKAGFTLYVVDDVVEAVSIFPEGYYDE